MLINLFENKGLRTKYEQPIGYMRKRKCEIVEDLSYYAHESASDFNKNFHIASVLKALEIGPQYDIGRTYEEIFGIFSDSHNEVEKLGVCKYARKYSVVLSFEDSLDYLLHRIWGARIDNVRSIPDYNRISRSILRLDRDSMQGNMGTLLSCDEKVKDGLLGIFMGLDEEMDEEEKISEFNYQVAMEIMGQLRSVLEYVACAFMSAIEKSAVLRSKSLCSFVLTSDTKIEDEIIIRSQGCDDYRINVRSFERKEYFHNLSVEYAV